MSLKHSSYGNNDCLNQFCAVLYSSEDFWTIWLIIEKGPRALKLVSLNCLSTMNMCPKFNDDIYILPVIIAEIFNYAQNIANAASEPLWFYDILPLNLQNIL